MRAPDAGGRGTLRCARHPNTETVLRCGRCDTPICPRCLVSTPVGARCPDCAQVKRFNTLLKPRELARAIGYGVGVSAIGTIILNGGPLLGPLLGTLIGALGLIGYALLGFLVGHVVSIGANGKRLRELGPIAVACLFVGYEVGFVALLLLIGRPLEVSLLLLPIAALARGLLIVGLLIGALLAWMRVR